MKPAGTRVLTILAGGLFLAGVTATEASAQMLKSTDRGFAAVNFGSQTKARTFTTSGSVPLYDETATFESSVGIGNDRIWDVNAGVRVWSNLALGAGYSRYNVTSASTVTASIPDPLRYDTPHSSSANVTGLAHDEGQIHLSAYWLQPVTDKFDIAIYAGPTFFSVKQNLPTGITVATGGTSIASVTQSTVDESAVGVHVGVDLRYLIVKYVGVGVFARLTSGSVSTDVVEAGKIDVGGFQYGAGLRIRF